MALAPRLIDVRVPERPEGVVLVLHGGYSRRADTPVSRRQLSVLRMVPIAKEIARTGGDGLAVFRVLNRSRGWPDHGPSSVDDVRRALGEAAERIGAQLAACLVGHSLGGRAALLSAGMPGVRGVAALAAWVYGDEQPAGIDGQEILFVHGDRDRVASIDRARTLANRLSQRIPVTFRTVEGGKHAMLGHHAEYTKPAAEFAAGLLLDRSGEARAAAA